MIVRCEWLRKRQKRVVPRALARLFGIWGDGRKADLGVRPTTNIFCFSAQKVPKSLQNQILCRKNNHLLRGMNENVNT